MALACRQFVCLLRVCVQVQSIWLAIAPGRARVAWSHRQLAAGAADMAPNWMRRARLSSQCPQMDLPSLLAAS